MSVARNPLTPACAASVPSGPVMAVFQVEAPASVISACHFLSCLGMVIRGRSFSARAVRANSGCPT